MRMLATSGRRVGLVLLVVAATLGGASAWYSSLRDDPVALVETAEADLQAGQWTAAMASLSRLERLRAPTPADRLLRARIAAGAGDESGALAELDRIADDPDLAPQALYLMGLIERRRGRVRYAEAVYRKAIARSPGLLKARRELVYILGMQFRRREVDAEFKALSRIAPLSQYDLYVWALTHFVTWGPDSAANLQSFIDADPDDRHSRLALATLLMAQPGQEARVAEVLRRLPQNDPDVLAIRIEQELNRGRVDEASEMIGRTGADDPRLARLKGRIAMSRGDRAGAARFFRQALTDEPYDRASNADLGKALLLQGDHTAAEPYLARARQLDQVYQLINRIGKTERENQPPDANQLGRACESAGLLDEARGWYLLAIGRNPLDAEAQRGVHRLRAMAREADPLGSGGT